MKRLSYPYRIGTLEEMKTDRAREAFDKMLWLLIQFCLGLAKMVQGGWKEMTK